jgi:multiple sugar transport system permease protein
MSSLKPELQLLRDSASFRAFLPVGDISVDNYRAAIERAPVARFIFNSILVTSITVILGLIVNSFAGFAIAIPRWKGKGIVLGLVIAVLILPFETIAVPLLLMVSRFPSISAEGFTRGWINTFHVQIIPWIVHPFSIFLFAQFFRELPNELVEAAKIDGASWWQVYRRVIVPISGPVFATAAILTVLPMWNQYLWPLMTVQSEEFRPVMVGLLPARYRLERSHGFPIAHYDPGAHPLLSAPAYLH